MSDGSGRLAGKVALVTGAGRNIGRATAIHFAREGADVVLNVRANRDEAESTAAEIRNLGRRGVVAVGDVADPAAMDAVVEKALAEFGRIDILLNVAAIRPHKPFLDLTTEDWERVRGVVLDGAIRLTQRVLRQMVERRDGRVVFFVGDGAWAGGAERAHVSAAKMALIGLCRGLATEFAPHGIRLNVVSPGRIDTSRPGDWYTQPMDRVDGIPLGRLGSTDDIADACLFLASDESRYVTGQTLHVNGGSAYF